MSNLPVKVNVTLDLEKVGENNVCEEVLQVLRIIKPNWCSNEDAVSSLRARVFTEGITNHLFGYYQDGKFNEDVVLFRVYGNRTEHLVDRRLEQKTMQTLHAAGRSPPLYASFNNGIAYGFVNGVTLDKNTVRDKTISRLIAEEMVELHAVRPDEHEVKAGLWDKMNRFLGLIPDKFEDPEIQKQFVAIVKSKDALRKEVEELKLHLSALNSPVVFCHNDLYFKNIIYNEEKAHVRFIDYEYASYNYEHYETGSHFAAYLGIENIDFSQYPDKAYQIEWLRHYLEQKATRKGYSPESVTDKDVETCYVKTNKFALADHLISGLWALAQVKNSLIEFGFIEYAREKLCEYFERKEEYLTLTLPS